MSERSRELLKDWLGAVPLEELKRRVSLDMRGRWTGMAYEYLGHLPRVDECGSSVYFDINNGHTQPSANDVLPLAVMLCLGAPLPFVSDRAAENARALVRLIATHAPRPSSSAGCVVGHIIPRVFPAAARALARMG